MASHHATTLPGWIFHVASCNIQLSQSFIERQVSKNRAPAGRPYLMWLQKSCTFSNHDPLSLMFCTSHQGCTSFCLSAHARCWQQPAQVFTCGSGNRLALLRLDALTICWGLSQRIGRNLLWCSCTNTGSAKILSGGLLIHRGVCKASGRLMLNLL